ncbi:MULTISPECIES: glycosyltransferase [unclassified Methylobacterium]|uniref:glycosyltransferase n=1 Tax=unclassified Methylobacterium TaxID=2615210 RepID=UPI0016502027|nr:MULTISPECIES: glycosyltransferase [unclassified Methylobacterium]
MSADLANAFFLKRGKVVDKWEQYLAIYARTFEHIRIRNEPVSLLEIGVQNGGSLEFWAEILPHGSTVIGLDIDPKIADLAFDVDGVRAFVVDATQSNAVEAVLGAQSFDIVIDDGSHRSSDIVAAFNILFPRVRPGGVYCIEDLHCSYDPAFEGGLRRPDSSIEWLKGLVDAVNADHVAGVESEERRQMMRDNRAIASVTFYDSVAVIEKLSVEKSRPYRRFISGEHAEIAPTIDLITNLSRDTLGAILFGHPAARNLEGELVRLLEEARGRAASLEAQLAKLVVQTAQAADDVQRMQAEQQAADAAKATATIAAAQQDAASLRTDLVARDERLAAMKARASEHRVEEDAKDREAALLRVRLERLAATHLHENATASEHRERVLAALAQINTAQAEAAASLASGFRQVASEVRQAERRGAARRGRLDSPLASNVPVPQLTWLSGAAPRENPQVSPPMPSRGLRRRIPLFERTRIQLVAKLFSPAWYRLRYPDVAASGMAPLRHYLRYGAAEGRDPHPLFSAAWYLEHAPDLRRFGFNPVVHYLTVGAAEGLDPHPLFDGLWYLQRYPDVRSAGVNPLLHYIEYGLSDLRDPNRLFSSSWYRDRNPDVAQAGMEPLQHFVQHGAAEFRDPHPGFQLAAHAQPNGTTAVWERLAHQLREALPADVEAIREAGVFDTGWYSRQVSAGKDAVELIWHYLLAGAALGLSPHPLFDSDWYLARYTDVGDELPLLHYLRVGAYEDRSPGPLVEPRWFRASRGYPVDANLNPLAFYLQHGTGDAGSPTPLFDPHWYTLQNPAVMAAGCSPLMHYITVGMAAGLAPNSSFDPIWYERRHATRMPLGLRGFRHFTALGSRQDLDPGPDFETGWYRGAVPDANTSLEPLAHYLAHGSATGRATLSANASTRVAVIAHISNSNAIGLIKSHLRAIDTPFDLYVTFPESVDRTFIGRLRRLKSGAALIPVPDRGFDIVPLFTALAWVRESGQTYTAICKIHAVKSRVELARKHNLLLNSILGSKPLVARIIRSFSKDPTLALVGSRDFYLDGAMFDGNNCEVIENLYRSLYPYRTRPRAWGFFAGTMFWFRPGLFDELGAVLTNGSTYDLIDRNDALLSQSVSRMFGLVAAVESGRVGLIDVSPAGDAQWDGIVQDAGGWTNQDKQQHILAGRVEAQRGKVTSDLAMYSHVLGNGQPELGEAFGVRFVAPVRALNGLGTSARGYLRSLKAAKTPLSVSNWTSGFERVRQIPLEIPPDGDQLIQITHLNLDLPFIGNAFDSFNSNDPLRRARYHILIPYFELVSLRPEWLPVLARFDEVWCASTFLERAINAASTIRTRVVRPTILPEIAQPGAFDRAYFGLPEGRFVFGYFADAGSILDRKNPLALVEAYIAEFCATDGACCFVKVHYGRRDHPTIARILAIASERPDVVFSEAIYADDEMEALIRLLDAYVSPHRSEGLGLTIVEAMNAGTPVIATNYGGAIDMLDPAASLPVDFRLTEVGEGNAPYPASYTWADPNPDGLRKAMRALFDDRDLARRLGAAGTRRVSALFGTEATALTVRAALDDIWRIVTTETEDRDPA